MKKALAVLLSAVMVLGLAACAQQAAAPAPAPAAETQAAAPAATQAAAPAATQAAAPAATEAPKEEAPKEVITFKVGFENSMEEPTGKAIQYWADIVKEKGDGSIVLEVFPDSQLGDKNALMDSMLLGERVITLADGAFFADYGVKDFGITVGPFLYDNWDQVWKLMDSDLYKSWDKQLEDVGIKILANNFIYGERHTMTTKKVEKLADLKGMKIRVPSNQIQTLGMEALGCTATGMALGDVYQALQTGTIDGAENPLATLYGRKLQEVAKYIVLDGHVKMNTYWFCSADVFHGLTPEQQQFLMDTAHEAGLFNNDLMVKADDEYKAKFIEEGCEIVELSDEAYAEFAEAAKSFYDHADEFGWTPGLYDQICQILGK